MARKPQARKPSPSPSTSASESESLSDPPTTIDPYATLSIDKSATSDQIKAAYRKAALRHHPDKASPDQKDVANTKFQEVAFAYAILSDENRRRRYDTTGSTAESLEEDDDFNWTDFFRSQKEAMVSADAIEQVRKEYQGSEEEREDVLRLFAEGEGDMDVIYEGVMCSNVLEDDDRFRKWIDEAIKSKQVKSYAAYAKETQKSKKERIKRAKGEADEAMELAEELGLKDKLFGNGKSDKKKGKGGDEDALMALIQQRQKGRAEGFFDQLEAKYGGGDATKKRRGKRAVEEPPEEMFQKNAKKVKGAR